MFGKISYREFVLILCGQGYGISDYTELKRWFKNVSVIQKPCIKKQIHHHPSLFSHLRNK